MKTLIYILSVLISVSGFSQAKLGMHTTYSISPAAATVQTVGVSYNTAITVKCYVQNKGNAVFNGNLVVMRAVRSGTLQTSASAVYTTNIISINPNDTIPITFTDSIKPLNYKQNGNGNTVVVWPFSPSAVTLDSLFTVPVYVNYATGIKELDKNKLSIYPNPVSQMLFIKPETDAMYKSITVYDMNMKTVLQATFTEQIDISKLPAGIYTVVVSAANGINYSSRFTKTEQY
ncbi:MAG: T9SS type A sorting domain-containing protein [Bacteroidota bacterium]